jgi:hypothetical protein
VADTEALQQITVAVDTVAVDTVVVEAAEATAAAVMEARNTNKRKSQRTRPTTTVTVWVLMETTPTTSPHSINTKMPKTTNPAKAPGKKNSPKSKLKLKNLLKKLQANCQNQEKRKRWK